MARKVVNRKALREEAEAAEKLAPKMRKAKRKSRAKEPVIIRQKLYWGVFNHTMKRVALFEYSQRKQADKKATDLDKAGKATHFVQKVKEAIQED